MLILGNEAPSGMVKNYLTAMTKSSTKAFNDVCDA
jgi:hypothetical protein